MYVHLSICSFIYVETMETDLVLGTRLNAKDTEVGGVSRHYVKSEEESRQLQAITVSVTSLLSAMRTHGVGRDVKYRKSKPSPDVFQVPLT